MIGGLGLPAQARSRLSSASLAATPDRLDEYPLEPRIGSGTLLSVSGWHERIVSRIDKQPGLGFA
jgi:hypothetical protein